MRLADRKTRARPLSLRQGIRRLTLTATLTGGGLLLAYIEAILPLSLGIPGVKLGLANLAVMLALLLLDLRTAFTVALLRVLLAGLLFGNLLSLAYSVSGCLVSFLVMLLLLKLGRLSPSGVGMAGGVAHNLAQLGCAALLLASEAVLWYLPVLLLSGTVAGLLIGLLAGLLAGRLAPLVRRYLDAPSSQLTKIGEMPRKEDKTMLTRSDIAESVRALGVLPGDTVLVHSSYKSLGPVEGGAEAVIGGFFDAVGPSGTVVFPTLCQTDFDHVYERWNKETSPSDVGYLTEYFRKLPGALRSDQASHSVAAIGAQAAYITADHGKGERHGIYGDTPFAETSPWEKLVELRAKILLLGLDDYTIITHRHLAEYRMFARYLDTVKGTPKYQAYYDRLRCYETHRDWTRVWTNLMQTSVTLCRRMEADGRMAVAPCGPTLLRAISAAAYVACLDVMIERDPVKYGNDPTFTAWVTELRAEPENAGRDFVREAEERAGEFCPPREAE